MDSKEFIVRILEILIWPVLALFAVLYFKKTLLDLFTRIQTIKHGSTEVTFTERLREIDKDEDLLVSTLAPIDFLKIKDRFEALMTLGKANKRAAVIEASEELDKAISPIVAEFYPEVAMQKHIPTEIREKALLKSSLKPSEIETVRKLKELRNLAYHSESFKVDDDVLASYIEKSLKMSYKIKNINPNKALAADS